MLGKYILLNHTRAFLLLFIVLMGILYTYLAGEVLLLFKDRSPEVFLSYTLNFLPIAFFYSGAFVNALALLMSFRRLFYRKIDLLVQSFGISPLRFFLWVLFFSVFLSFLNLSGSYQLYPESQKRLFSIEKEYKKARELESGVVRNLWLTEERGGEVRFYNFGLVDLSTGRVYGFYLLRVRDNSMKEMVTASDGHWKGNRVEFKQASIKDLVTGEEKIRSFFFDFLELSQVGPLAEKPEHLSAGDVFLLSLLGKRIGINYRHYAYELLRRFLTSLLPILVSLIVGWVYIRWRQLRLGLLALLASFSAHWFFINLMKSAVENTNLSIYLLFLIYTPLPLLALKGLYDLGKGFRV